MASRAPLPASTARTRAAATWPSCCRSIPTARRAGCATPSRPADVGVIVTDSFGRPFRFGTTGVAVGCAGLAPVRVHTGESDDAGRVLQGTELHVADRSPPRRSSSSAPSGGVPAAVVRGVAFERSDAGAGSGADARPGATSSGTRALLD